MEDTKTLRDEFAIAALQGLLANGSLTGAAETAYIYADEMLEARKIKE